MENGDYALDLLIMQHQGSVFLLYIKELTEAAGAQTVRLGPSILLSNKSFSNLECEEQNSFSQTQKTLL